MDGMGMIFRKKTRPLRISGFPLSKMCPIPRKLDETNPGAFSQKDLKNHKQNMSNDPKQQT